MVSLYGTAHQPLELHIQMQVVQDMEGIRWNMVCMWHKGTGQSMRPSKVPPGGSLWQCVGFYMPLPASWLI